MRTILKNRTLGPLLHNLGPLLVPFMLKIGSPLGPLFRIFGSPFDFVTVDDKDDDDEDDEDDENGEVDEEGENDEEDK